MRAAAARAISRRPEAGEKGGVRLAKSLDDVRIFADQMLSHTLVTLQTGAAGRVVKRLLVEEGAAIARELYLSFLVDRATSRVAIIASTEGGMNIEDVAHNTPEKIFTMTIDPATGFSQFHGRQVAFALGLQGRSDQAMREADRQPVPGLHREGHEPSRNQPAHRDGKGRSRLPRREAQFRRQCPLPPSRRHEHARPRRGGPGRGAGLALRPLLREARRQYRLPRERRRPRHGDHGYHQALWRGARELPGRGRRRDRRRR